MSCPRTDLISAYLDKELGLREKTALETHLHGCSDCSHALEELRSLRAAFSGSERHPAPYGFATRVMARTAELERKKTPWFVPLFIGFAEAAILLIVITMGIVAGKVMTNGSPAANIASSLSLDLFDATPPGSLGGAYLAMTEAGNEK
jgi:anti-sigma factor RsiW